MRAINPARIARSLVTILALSLLNTVGLTPSFLPSASAVNLTTGTCTVDGTNMSTSNIIDTTGSDGTCTIRLTSGTSSFIVPAGVNTVTAMVVGGGGGGGFGGNGGGGGAGAVISSNSGVTATPGTVISGTVGGGGTSGYTVSQSTWTKGGKGTDSSLTINSATYISSGGGGGSNSANGVATTADDGGSGGGKAIDGFGPGNGFNLDYVGWTERVFRGASNSGVGGGGGGGAGGSPATSSSNGAVGVAIFGYSVGGGGSGWQGGSATDAAPFGGGAPRDGSYNCPSNNCNGTANTGGGGGGGGAGGSGVIVVKFVQSRGQGTIVQTNGFQINRTSTFTFTRTGAVPTSTSVTYQWQVKPAGSSTWSNVTTGTGGTTLTYQTPILSASDNGNTYRIGVTDTQSTYGISTTTFTETSVQTLFTPPGSETDTALTFNGTTQYGWVADTGTGGVFDITGAITLQAWVNPTESLANTQYTVICKSEAYQLFHFGGFWKYSLQGSTGWGSGVPTGIKVALNEWHHIAITRVANTNAVNFYYDGQLVFSGNANTAASSTIASNNLAFGIGGMVYNNPLPTLQYPFKGQIDHVAIFDVARSLADIDSDMDSYISPSTAGLRAYYDFNETSGSTLFNRTSTSTINSDLALIASPTFNDVKSVSSTSAHTTIRFPRTYINTSGGWVVPSGVSQVGAFIVGGGGGGGWNSGGGGGGGGFLIQNNITVSGTVGVQIGSGGRGGQGPDTTAPTYTPADGFPTIFNGTTVAGGNKGTIFTTVTGGPPITTASGVSGVGGTGGATNGTPGGAGGAGFSQSNFGDTLIYSAGGGGGGYNAAGGVGGNSASSGAGNGGGSVTTTGTSGLANRGGGGGASSARVDAGNGGSGVVIVKYLVASSKPIFSGPFNDTTTAGLVETFTVTGTPNSPLVRSYQWQVSTDTGTSWAAPTLGSGINSASYVTQVLTTSVSGSRFQYRVIVTDSDTAGLRMSETSSAVFLIINPALTLTGNTTIQKAINVVKVETFTVTGGTATHRYSLTPTISGITLDTSTALAPVIRISETKTVGTYYETLTVTDSASVSVSLPITIQVIAPPSFSATSEVVESGTVLNLDAASTASYPLSGNTWSDLSGRKITANLIHNTGTSSVNANGATRTGAAWLNSVQCVSPTFANDGIGSLTFNGSSTCSYVSNFGYLPTYTYEAWVKRDGDQSIGSTVITTPYRFTGDQINISLIWNSASALAAGIFNGNTSNGWSSTPIVTVPNLTWVHAAVTFNGSTLTLIINGDTTTSTAVSVTWNPAIIDNGLLLGRKWDFSQTFKGSVGSIQIYDRVLALSEIQQNYNATKSRFATTGNKAALTKRYGTLVTETYTVTSGLGPISVTLARNLESALRWDTSTARSTRLTAQESLTVGTYLETVTATDALGQSVYLPLRYTVTQADTLTISMDTPTVVTFNNSQITVFPKPVYKGLVGVDTLTVTTRFSSASYTISATRPTNADAYTVSATAPVFTVGAASNYLAVIYETSTAVVNKARQDALNPSIYGASIGSPFSLSLLGGSGDGAITETLTGVSTAPNCAISARSLSSSTTSVAYCTVTFTKASSQNYLSESITVQIFFMSYVINQPAPAVGSGPTIAISGETAIIRDPNAAPSITDVTTSGDITYPIAISGLGFTAASAGSTTIKFWRNQILGAGDFVVKSDTLIWAKQHVTATLGKILLINNNGTAASPVDFTPAVFTP